MRRQLEKIVVGTSLSEASDSVVKAAMALRARCGAELYLVHAFPMPIVYGGGVYGTSAIHQQLDYDQQRHRRQLDSQLERIDAADDDFAQIIVELDSGDRLLDNVAEQKGADLIVVGAHENHRPLDGFLGSTADRLLRRTQCPVLVARGEWTDIHHVVAPVDLSPLAENSMTYGLELLDALQLEEVPRVDALFVLSRIDREGSAHFEPAQMDRFALEELDAFIARIPNRPAGQVSSTLRNGLPRREILDYLDGHDADLVLLGTHGRSGFERFLMGSVAAEVLRHLDRHALVIPPGIREEAKDRASDSGPEDQQTADDAPSEPPLERHTSGDDPTTIA